MAYRRDLNSGLIENRPTWSRMGKERRRAELLYTCEIHVNGRVVARTQGSRPPMSCPSTRAGKPALTFPFFSIDSDPVRVQSRRFLHRRDRALHRSKQRSESVTRLRAYLPFQDRAKLNPTRGFVNLRGDALGGEPSRFQSGDATGYTRSI